jgi:hypothetical protein
MGTAHVEMHPNLLAAIAEPPFSDLIRVHSKSLVETEIWLVLVSSPLLAKGYQGQKSLVLGNGKLRFVTYTDGDIGAGRNPSI